MTILYILWYHLLRSFHFQYLNTDTASSRLMTSTAKIFVIDGLL